MTSVFRVTDVNIKIKTRTNLFPSEDRGSLEEEERRRRMQVVEKFQTAPFEEIAATCGSRVRTGRQMMSDRRSVKTVQLLF